MAIKDCKECGGKVSDTAAACPHCGYKTQKKEFGCGALFVVVVGGFFLFAIFNSDSNDSTASVETPDSEPSAAAIGFLALKKAMRDPDSFVLEGALARPGNDVVCFTYRAKNGFGGYTNGSAVFKKSVPVLKSNEQAGFRSLWNKECKGKSGDDVAGGLNMLPN